MNIKSYLGQHHTDQTALDNGASLMLGECTRPHDGKVGCMVIHKIAKTYMIYFHEKRGAHDDEAFTTNGSSWYELRLDHCDRVLRAINYTNFIGLMNKQLNF